MFCALFGRLAPRLTVLGLGLAATVWGQSAGGPGEEGAMGKWNPPPENLSAWTHAATGLRFPVRFQSYEMGGVFDFGQPAGDHLVRYLNPEQRARGDVFLVTRSPKPEGKEAVLEAINEALIRAVDDLVKMAEAGRYDDLKAETPLEGKIELWKVEPIPLMVQQVAATRIEKDGDKETRVPVKLWYGGTVFEGQVVLIRHMRRADSGEAGEADMKQFVEAMTHMLKDPYLRRDMLPAMRIFVAQPLTKDGQEAAKLALGYLDSSPMVPVLLPQPPLTVWADEMEKLVPNAGSQLLKAFVISGALAALEGKDNAGCLTLACQQVARVFLELQRLNQQVRHAGLEELTKAVERGEVATWFNQQVKAARARE